MQQEWLGNFRADILAGLAVIYLLPHVTQVVPSPFICIILLMGVSLILGLDIQTVGDMGELLMIEFPGHLFRIIPMAALVAIMIMVSIGTFCWSSLVNLRIHPRSSSIVMLATVIVVASTHNLAIGVLVGVLFSRIFFAWKIAQIFRVTSILSADEHAHGYIVEGQLFFASTDAFTDAVNFREVLEKVVIDVSKTHIQNLSSVQALDMVFLKFRREGREVTIVGLNEASETIADELAIHDKPRAPEDMIKH